MHLGIAGGRDQDPRAQLDLNDSTHNAVSQRNVKTDRRDVVAVIAGGDRPLVRTVDRASHRSSRARISDLELPTEIASTSFRYFEWERRTTAGPSTLKRHEQTRPDRRHHPS